MSQYYQQQQQPAQQEQQTQQQEHPDFLQVAQDSQSSLNKPILGLLELIDRILDKGLVIDAFISITVVGVPLLVIRARIVVASLDTFLRYSEAMGLRGEPGEKVEQRQQPQQQQQAPQQFAYPQQQQQQPAYGMAA
jgi:gas vesicle structural protein